MPTITGVRPAAAKATRRLTKSPMRTGSMPRYQSEPSALYGETSSAMIGATTSSATTTVTTVLDDDPPESARVVSSDGVFTGLKIPHFAGQRRDYQGISGRGAGVRVRARSEILCVSVPRSVTRGP